MGNILNCCLTCQDEENDCDVSVETSENQSDLCRSIDTNFSLEDRFINCYEHFKTSEEQHSSNIGLRYHIDFYGNDGKVNNKVMFLIDIAVGVGLLILSLMPVIIWFTILKLISFSSETQLLFWGLRASIVRDYATATTLTSSTTNDNNISEISSSLAENASSLFEAGPNIAKIVQPLELFQNYFSTHG
jgi:hypothetical protein